MARPRNSNTKHIVRFSVDEFEYKALMFQSKARGLTPSTYAKSATFAHLTKHPARGLTREVTLLSTEEVVDPYSVGTEANTPEK